MSDNDGLVKGLGYALSAFLLWGLAPVYFKLVASVSAFEVLAHRVVWSVLILAVVVQFQGGWQALRALDRNTLKQLFFSSIFVSLNWLVFIWAVGQGRVLETSLGYFINPLITVIFGVVFLNETLRKWQVLAICLAFLGVSNQVVQLGYLPWVALVLALSFASYGLMRKSIDIQPVQGLFVETLLLLPAALFYLAWLGYQGELVFGSLSTGMDGTLIASGFMTTIPLLLFAAGARRLSLTVIGIAQYITPSITFFLAVFLYGESFSLAQLVSFMLIWLGLLVFTLEGGWVRRKAR
jgi:chloramphenicol-sensitive protein RarD